jgi:isopenicillin N synthase-like dioxygenase
MLELSIVDVERLRSGTAAEKGAAVATLGRACRDTGFFYVSGHGITSAAKDALFHASRRFFALPLEVKKQVSGDYLLSRLNATYEHRQSGGA